MFKVKVSGGNGIKSLAKALQTRGLVPEFRAAFDETNKVYREFLRARFFKYSKGGGNWRKLSEATLKRRRAKGNFSKLILQDTKQLIGEFQPKIVTTHSLVSGGQQTYSINYGTTGSYPSGVSVTKVASYHQNGTASMPARKIVVGMDKPTSHRVANIWRKAIKFFVRRTGSSKFNG